MPQATRRDFLKTSALALTKELADEINRDFINFLRD